MNKQNYGFCFNSITIKDGEFIKKSKNSYGKMKINNEINFYKNILDNKIDFPIPQLKYFVLDDKIAIEFIENSDILTNIINKKNRDIYIKRIKDSVNIIHKIKLKIDNVIIMNDLKIETQDKILNRYDKFPWEKNFLFNSILSVNGVKFKNIKFYTDTIYSKLKFYLKDRDYYNIIHGDIHLGNILIDNQDNIFFIDPRGYFGESSVYGLQEYDFAKLLFGLSGYSIFDLMEIKELKIKEGNIEIEFIKKYENYIEGDDFDKITKLLFLSMWLGNNSCFIDFNKKITSLMIAFYYCEKYLFNL